MNEEHSPKLRETLQIKRFDDTQEDNPAAPVEVLVSDRVYNRDRTLISSDNFTLPGWIGEWSLHNAKMRIVDARLGSVEATHQRDKVAIIGCQREYIPTSVMNDPTWEVWGCNSLWNVARDDRGRFRADRWFELHPMFAQTDMELHKIKTCPVPIYTLGLEEFAHNSVIYPLGRVERLWPFRYFTCTFAYQVALAIADRFKEIGIFGMELMYGTARECTFERACLEFWLGVAYGKGIKVHFHSKLRLCRHPFRYGYDYDKESEFCNRKTSLLAYMAFCKQDFNYDTWMDGCIEEKQIEQADYDKDNR